MPLIAPDRERRTPTTAPEYDPGSSNPRPELYDHDEPWRLDFPNFNRHADARDDDDLPHIDDGAGNEDDDHPDDGNGGDDDGDAVRWITVATFWDSTRAHIARLKLESEDIDCVVFD